MLKVTVEVWGTMQCVRKKKEKERLQWKGFAEKGFMFGMKERVNDEKLIIITNKCNYQGHK